MSAADALTAGEFGHRAVYHALETRLLLEKVLIKASKEEPAGYPELVMSLVDLDERMEFLAEAVTATIDEESMEALLREVFPDLEDPFVVLDPECWWGAHLQIREVAWRLYSEAGQRALSRLAGDYGFDPSYDPDPGPDPDPDVPF